jgi:hypothetical protein
MAAVPTKSQTGAGMKQRMHLAIQVYDLVFQESDSFEMADVGADLAYLLGAILKGTQCEWPHDRPIVQLLHEHMELSPVWNYITIEAQPHSPLKPLALNCGECLDKLARVVKLNGAVCPRCGADYSKDVELLQQGRYGEGK